MKSKSKLALCILFGIYFAGYLYVRFAFCEEGSITKPNPNGSGYLPFVEYTKTDVWIPSSGRARWAKYVVYWLYRPLGFIDEKMTGREYGKTDEQYIIY